MMCSTNDVVARLYGCDAKDITQFGHGSVYRIDCDEGLGIITQYAVFSGIDVCFNDIHINTVGAKKELFSGIYEMNHCKKGRFECYLKDGAYTYMGPGDFAVSSWKNPSADSIFPVSHYYGVSIYIYPEKLGKDAEHMQECLGFQYETILQRLCDKKSLFIIRSTPEIQHIFSEIYSVPEKIMMPYLKIKIQELFLYLGSQEIYNLKEEREYFAKSSVDLVKAMHQFILSNLDRHFTQEELAERFGLSVTTMKRCYKSIYGKSIYANLKSARIQKAVELLKTTDQSVTEIALTVGYSNVAKFSTAFKAQLNSSPTEFRKMSVRIGKSGRFGVVL